MSHFLYISTTSKYRTWSHRSLHRGLPVIHTFFLITLTLPATPISIREWNANLPSSPLFIFPHLFHFFPPLSPLFSCSGHEHFVKYTRDVSGHSRAHSNSSSSDVNESVTSVPAAWKTPRHHFITLLQSPAAGKIRLKIGVDACAPSTHFPEFNATR